MLKLHPDVIVKQGELKQKNQFFSASWKRKSFVFDGHVLYNVSTPSFTVKHKYILVTNEQTINSDHIVSKVVDAKVLTGKENTIGFFFQDASSHPLFLMALNSTEHSQWLSVLQKALQKNQQPSYNIHQAVEAMVDMAVISDAFGVIQCVNNSLLQYFGYIRSELLYKNVKLLMDKKLADQHDVLLERYRKTNNQRLIGVPRVLQAKMRNGELRDIVLSLGEVPDSTNADPDRFLAVMKPVVSEQPDITRPKTDTAFAPIYNMIDTMGTNINQQLSQLEDQFTQEISQTFIPISEQCRELQAKIESLESDNAKLMNVTTQHQQHCIDYLHTEIEKLYAKTSKLSKHDSLVRHDSAKKLEQMKLSVIGRKASTMHSIIEKQHADFDEIMNNEISMKYFMCFAATEQATDHFKFFLYLNKHYKNEVNREQLAVKRDFIMDTFIRSGTLHELNLSSRNRATVEEEYRKLSLNPPADVTKEQTFFDCVVKGVVENMFDTYSRFRSHALYQYMKDELYEASLHEYELINCI
jgi:PAS domain S-box-containing protein